MPEIEEAVDATGFKAGDRIVAIGVDDLEDYFGISHGDVFVVVSYQEDAYRQGGVQIASPNGKRRGLWMASRFVKEEEYD